jgi:hypothetical protein
MSMIAAASVRNSKQYAGFLGWTIDPMVYKWAQIVVGLLCIIAVVAWLAGVLGFGGGPPYFWRYG